MSNEGKEPEPVVTNINDIVRNRLERDAVEGVNKLLETEKSAGVIRDKDDMSRPLTYGEARKLVGEINGSFDKITKWVTEVNQIITNQGAYIQELEQRLKAQEVKLNELVLNGGKANPIPLPNSPFATKHP
jgi:hypothetical protein